MFQRLLVPLDGSPVAERAIPVAARLARASGGTIILLHVAGLHVEYGPYLAQATAYAESIIKTEIASAHYYLERLARSKDLAGITVLTEVLPGIPTHTILSAVRFHHVDLIVFCSHGYTGVKRWMLSGVAQKLVRQCTIPVLVLRPGSGALMNASTALTHPIRVVVGLDGSAFAQDAILPAAQLVAALNPRPMQRILHLTQAVKSSSRHLDSPYEQLHSDVDLHEEAWREASSYLRTIAETSARQIGPELGVHVTWSVTEDRDVVDAIIDVAELGEGEGADTSEVYDVIALATHGREGFQRWMIGSITERVLDGTKLPLLIVHPQEEHQSTQRELALEEYWREKV